jgi:tRNA-2-methylthio-N6-dimethylallyladenosine synthase
MSEKLSVARPHAESVPSDTGLKAFVQTYGCQMNKLDSEVVCSALRDAGYQIVEDAAHADVILFNTCSVREHAEERVFSNLGNLKRLKHARPDLLIGVIGCMAQRLGDQIRRRAPHVDVVCGTRMFPRIAELLEEARHRAVVATQHQPLDEIDRRVALRPIRHSAYLAIMRGCDNHCAYCVVPALRGPEVSRSMEEIEDEARRLVDDGCAEITLLGQNVDSYGRGLSPPASLADLLRRLAGITGLRRLRFVTSHPRFISHELLEAMRDQPVICPHIHMPAQSGSNRILAAMRRGYTRERYLEVVALARELVPGVAFASDFIVGFPGESDADFEESRLLMETVRFQNSFIFKYSPRPGTVAADLPDDIPREVKERRNRDLLQTQEAISRVDNSAYVGAKVAVLVDGPSKSRAARLSGRLATNHIVVFDGEPSLTGRVVDVAIENVTALTLSGSLWRP